ncbi:MAG: 16S rRNA (cytosine(967)-C(5))-methyltransferase RsmB [Myxococcales bacterium]|nr:16S rRNA (cytosine(967)-C(5))-methyltransferase RsmB [Myxococcales bacterium]
MGAKTITSFDPSRELALEILERVERQGAFASHELNHAFAAVATLAVDVRPRRAFTSELVYGTLARRGRIDWSLARAVARGLDSVQPRTLTLLRLAVYELLFLGDVPEHASVHTAVELARRRIHPSQAKFVNAVLRTVLRRLTEEPDELAARTSHPQWIVDLYRRLLPEDELVAALEANNDRPPLTIRARGARAELAAELASLGFTLHDGRLAPNALIVENPEGLFETQLFLTGAFVAQDEAAQLVGELAAPRTGELVVEIGAGLGGKTTHLAELSGGGARILALDTHAGRLRRLEERAAALGLRAIETRRQDATAPLESWSDPLAASVDCVVIDAPCSGLGVLRRQPEIRWRRDREAIAIYAARQRQMIERAGELLRPGGRLIYAVCTVTDEEGPRRIREAIDSGRFERLPTAELVNTAGSRLPSEIVTAEGDLRTWPHRDRVDGFFISRLRATH